MEQIQTHKYKCYHTGRASMHVFGVGRALIIRKLVLMFINIKITKKNKKVKFFNYQSKCCRCSHKFILIGKDTSLYTYDPNFKLKTLNLFTIFKGKILFLICLVDQGRNFSPTLKKNNVLPIKYLCNTVTTVLYLFLRY
jgi:hypothetical protein